MFQVIPLQKIHMKNQALFSSKDKSKTTKMSSAAIFVWRFKGEHVNVFGYSVTSTAKYFPCILESAVTDQLIISLNPAKRYRRICFHLQLNWCIAKINQVNKNKNLISIQLNQ